MRYKALRPIAGAVLAVLLGFIPAAAQSVTTGALTGRVVDESDAGVPGATIEAVHEPTGTTYSGVSGSDGGFSILNVRSGGPYSVTASLSGFKSEKRTAISVVLGGQTAVSFQLKVEALAESVEVVAEGGNLISPGANGPASNVGEDAIETLPTVNRGIEDFARLSPYFNSQGSGAGDGANALSVAGRNTRYNNVQIDGAINNDLFGLADSGTPGGQTESQPVSIDAVQELQLVVAPYDVRQGGFSGGGVNAITRSGSNTFQGTAYYFFRSEGLVGDGPNDRPIATFSDKQFGASLGGPIVRDKAFFFANVELGRRERPSGWSIDGASGQAFGRQQEAARFLSILQNRYNYDPGGTAEFIRDTPNDKVLAKLDFNLSSQHRLSLRHNYIKARNDIGFPSSTNYFFPDFFYQFRDTTNSTVAQLNSTFGSSKVNELRVTYQRVRDNRDGQSEFPTIFVDVSGGGQFRAGRENFSTANALDQDILEVTDDFTIVRGRHSFTIGTHNEFFQFRNLFIRDNFGNYRFSSLDNLEAGLAQSYDYSFSLTGDRQQSAEFGVSQFGVYAGDLWRVSPRFTLNYGVRLDVPHFPDKPSANPAAVSTFGFGTDVVPAPKMWSPRAGFNWDVDGTGKSQVRGGLGLFTGRTPYVWLSNQYGNTGIEFRRIGASFNVNNRIPFVADPANQPATVTGANAGSFSNEIDVIDPDYKFPSLFRGNIGYDREVWGGVLATAEFFYSSNVKDIDYKNLNLRQTGTRPDGRPTFTRNITTFSDVILLTNTDDGYQWSATAKLERPFRNGWYAMAAYNYGEAKSVNDGTSSQAASNWGNAYTQGDPNDVGLGRSRFAPGHRVILAFSYDLKIGSRANVLLSAFYNGQQGRSYAFTFNGDWNGDGRFTNDLMYVPAENDPKVVFINGTAADWEAYVAADKGLQESRGRIMEKGASRSPWTNQLDVRAALGIPVSRTKLEITFDMLNFLNLLNSDWGVVDNATFGDLNPIPSPTVNASGQMVFNLANINRPGYVKFDRDDLRSRWQGQVGVRVRF